MTKQIRASSVIALHRILSTPLQDIVHCDVSNFLMYVLEHGIEHALSIPEKILVYQTIERWMGSADKSLKRKALRGILLLLQYPETIDEGMTILSRTDKEIRGFLSSVVPEPIVRSAEVCATIGQREPTTIEQSDLIRLIFLFSDIENLITYLLVIQCADILYKGHTLDNVDGMFTRTTLGMKVRSIIQMRQVKYEATMPTLQNLPEQIFLNLQQSAVQLVSLRNQFMHGAIDSQDPNVYQQIYNMAWDFKLLFFCLCECQTDFQTHHDVILNDTKYQLCTPNLVYKGQSISLWPFYLVLRLEEQTYWFVHNVARVGQSKYIIIHTNDKTYPFNGGLRLEHQSIDGILSLCQISMSEFVLKV